MKKIFALLATLLVAACNPLTIDEAPVLAGDFSDPIYPKTYGRVSLDLSIDPKTALAEAGKADIKSLHLEFYFRTSSGEYVLCKEYESYGDMPSVVLFPVGRYIVVARTKQYSQDREYLRGQIDMTVSESSAFGGKIVCLLLAAEFADPVYPKVYGQVALDMKLQLGELFSSSRSVILPDAQRLQLDFYSKSADGNWSLCKHYDRAADLPKGVSFPVGNYKLVAHSHAAMSEVMSEPYVHGESQFAVAAQNETSVTVVGSLRNAWVEVQPTASYLRAMHSWGATLREESLTAPYVRLTKDSALVRFVRPAVWNVEVDGKQVGDNLPRAYTQALGTLSGGDRALVVLDAVDRGVLGVAIDVKVDITRRDHAIVFPDDEGELGTGGYDPNPKPDPEPTDPQPTIVGDGIDVDQTTTITDADFGADEKLKYSLKVVATAKTGGIQKFEITIESTHPVLSPETITAIFDGTTFDLANVPSGSNLENNLDGFGILPLGKKIKGDESFVFDLTDFMGMLPVHTDSHNFTLRVTDGKGKSAQKTIRIKRVK